MSGNHRRVGPDWGQLGKQTDGARIDLRGGTHNQSSSSIHHVLCFFCAQGGFEFSHRNHGICWDHSQAKVSYASQGANQNANSDCATVSVFGRPRVRLTTIGVPITITIPVCRNEVKTVAALWIQL